MNAIKLFINRVLIVLFAIIRHYKGKKKVMSNKMVLILFQQAFGDAVVLSDSIMEYEKIFSEENGYKIKMLIQPAVKSFLSDNYKIPKSIDLIAVDFKRLLSDYRYFLDVVKQYNGKADVIIVPGTSLSAEVFSVSCNANRKIGLIRPFPVKKPIIYAWFYKNAYTDIVIPPKNTMMLQRQRMLINKLGNEKFRAKLPKLKKKERIIYNNYCVLCPGASKMEKCWPTERFIEIADYIIEKYNMDVHLCGGADETKFAEIILQQTRFRDKIFNHIGNTTFSEWASIVAYAKLVVGNDSATLHLAASSNRRAVCIAGVYDKYQFFPYKVDKLDKGERLPVAIIKGMPCEYCRTVGYVAGYGNTECKKRIKNGRCALCIEKITVEEVIEEIDALMDGYFYEE